MSSQVKVPVGKIIRLVAKAVRFSKGGFTRDERRELGLDLLELAAFVLDDLLDDLVMESRQGNLFDSAGRIPMDAEGLSPDQLT